MGEYVLCGYFLEPGPEPLVLGIAGDGYAEEAVIRPKAAVPRVIARELLLTPEELNKGLTWDQAARQVLSGAEDGSHILTLAAPQVIVSKFRSWAREAGRTLTFADITSACALAWPAAGPVTAASICASAGIDPGPLRGPQAQAEAVLQALPGLKRALARDAAPALLADCQARGELLEWPLAPGFAEIVAAAVEHLRSSRDPATLEEALNSPDRPRRPRRPAEGAVSGAQAVEAALGPGGSVEATMPGYESRPRQLEMAMTVAGAVDRDEILLAEAGTGIGKSLAYLIPLALHVTATGERALVSTATRTLQDQLLDHDVPLVRRALDLDLAVTVMKGRTNYICLRKLLDAYKGARDSLLVDDRLRLLPVMAWALRSTTLDLAELSTRAGGESAEALRALAADHETCIGAACDMRRGCALSRLRLRAAASDLLIINHALWFAGSAVGTIPEVHRVVFDEAHTLEDVATDHYTLELSADALERIMLRVHNPADGDGVIAATESLLEAAIPPPQDALALARSAREMAQQILSSCSALGRLCEALADKLDPGGRAGRSRLRPEVTRLLPYQHLAEFTEDTCVELRSLAEILDQLAGLLGELEDSPMGELELLAIATGELRSQSAELQGYAEAAEEVIALSDPDRVFFLERTRSEAVVRAAPVEVGRDLARQVFEPRPTVILTSATLSVGGDMSYFQDRLGLGQVSERLIAASYPSEFDYSTQTCFCVPTDVPDPREEGWLDAVGEAIVELVQATRGRALVLFTSRAHLEAVYESRRRDIEALGIPTYSQLANLSRAHVRRAFSQDVSSVLFATRSFFEGVDIPGESLSSVVLTRLPFAVPTDPIVEARREKVAERGHDPMEAYYIPQAVITFRQAFGRLIRRKTDRGSVIVLDPRIVRKRYGKRFMESVPECRVVQKPLGAVADFLSRFFDEG